jgi:hypothetical protein
MSPPAYRFAVLQPIMARSLQSVNANDERTDKESSVIAGRIAAVPQDETNVSARVEDAIDWSTINIVFCNSEQRATSCG